MNENRAADTTLDDARRVFLAKVDRATVRLTRRVDAILGDLARIRTAEDFAVRISPFVAEAARAPRGTTKLVSVDWSSGEPLPCELPLDPSRSPREQLEASFARARRLKQGSTISRARLAEARAKLERLAVLRSAALSVTLLEDLVSLGDAAYREDPSLLPGVARPAGRPLPAPRRHAERLPYRTFVTASGARILVGRGASDNDALTLHVARPYDLWLHAREERGAHVVVPLPRGHDVTPDLLVDAAHLAAHFSEGRGETLVDVTYSPKRFVRKRRGSPPGLVQVDRGKTLRLRVDTDRLAALLAREEA